MQKIKIKLQTGKTKENAKLIVNYNSLTLIRKNGFRKTYTDHDLYLCLAQIRREFPVTKFLCKRAKVNVFPSSMCSQMSNGAVAYELKLGEKATFDAIVNIFEYEDKRIAHDISEQRAFFRQWVDSFSDSDLE